MRVAIGILMGGIIAQDLVKRGFFPDHYWVCIWGLAIFSEVIAAREAILEEIRRGK